MENEIVIEGVVTEVTAEQEMLLVKLNLGVRREYVTLEFTAPLEKASAYYIGRRVRLVPKPLPRSAT